jgi:integrase
MIVELPDHLRDLTRFCYLTSWRKAEALGLKWESVDLKGRVITLPTSRNGKRRSLALAGEVLEILKRREAARLVERNGEPRVSDFAFHWHGQQIVDFKRAWRTAVKDAGLPPKMFHDLRRSGIRNMVRAGEPETVAMSISGHRTRSTFDRYSITSGSDQQGHGSGERGRLDSSRRVRGEQPGLRTSRPFAFLHLTLGEHPATPGLPILRPAPGVQRLPC